MSKVQFARATKYSIFMHVPMRVSGFQCGGFYEIKYQNM